MKETRVGTKQDCHKIDFEQRCVGTKQGWHKVVLAKQGWVRACLHGVGHHRREDKHVTYLHAVRV